jgi:hypothetical protein
VKKYIHKSMNERTVFHSSQQYTKSVPQEKFFRIVIALATNTTDNRSFVGPSKTYRLPQTSRSILIVSSGVCVCVCVCV